MIPLRDANLSRTVPFVTFALILMNMLAFLAELSAGSRINEFFLAHALVPDRLVEDLRLLRFAALPPLVTSMFLHGGWMHLLGNMLFLHIFGDNVEDRFGHLNFLGFYLLAGIAAALTQVVAHPASATPVVGASGAIAGVLGAYVLLFPKAKVATLLPVFFQVVELPAFLFLGLWFAMQLVSGVLSLRIGADAGGVAWWAHVGGFAAGALAVPIVRRRG